MKSLKFQALAKLAATGLLVLAGSAQAHTGHDASGLVSGLFHPLGLDHMLAMLAVGLWSVNALPAQRAWQGPALFMLALMVGAVIGLQGLQFAMLEHLTALSLVLFGALLMMRVHQVPVLLGWGVVALSGLVHGMAHGAEAPAHGISAYAFGFLATTAVLHFAGIATGLGLRNFMSRRSSVVVVLLGSILSLAGLYLIGHA